MESGSQIFEKWGGVLTVTDATANTGKTTEELLRDIREIDETAAALGIVRSNLPKTVLPSADTGDEPEAELRWQEDPALQEQPVPAPQIPEFLTSHKRWSVFKKTWNPEREKYDKTPCTPVGGSPYPGYPNPENDRDLAFYADVKKLCDLDDVYVPAFYLLKTDGLMFADYDDPAYIPDLPTYTEKSISGGYHVLAWYKGPVPKLPGTREVYLDRRWIVVTGDVVDGKVDINDLTELIAGMQEPGARSTPGHTEKFSAPEKITANRNNTLTSMAGSLRARGHSSEEILSLLTIANKTRCQPPLDDREVQSIALGVGRRYPAGDLPGATRRQAPDPSPAGKNTINASKETHSLTEHTDLCIKALTEIYNVPHKRVFIRGGILSHVAYDEKGDVVIREMKDEGVRCVLDKCCDFVTYKPLGKKDGKELFETVKARPPKDVSENILASPDLPERLPPLVGLVEAPYITREGVVVTKPGYNDETGLYFAACDDYIEVVIPERPTREDVKIAVAVLNEIYVNFPFVDKASRTNTIATLISAVVRPMITGLVPMALFSKAQAGTGASLISKTIALVATGKPATMITAPDKDEEWRKKITATLQAGRTIAIVDNIENKLYAPSLAALLTAEIWEDRILGVSKNITLPNNTLWIGNGNNVLLGGDLPRRCYMVNLLADSARPWQRDEKEFAHPQLLEWVSANRTRIINSILTITRAWILAGRPAPGEAVPRIGGFEEWRAVVGGIVVYAELPDFLGNLEEMYQLSDTDTPQWELFFERWFGKWKDTPTSVKTVIDELWDSCDATQSKFSEEVSLFAALPDMLIESWNGKKNFPRVFGNRLAKMNNRIFCNGLQLKKGNVEHQAVTWKVCKHVKGELVK